MSKSEKELEAKTIELIKSDPWMMDILQAAQKLNLSDWMIGAGFVRNKVWDYLHGYSNKEVSTNDIDLIYFDPDNLSKDAEKMYDAQLSKIMLANWSCKNQARMHKKYKRKMYKNSKDALAHWVETATAVAMKLENDRLKIIAPYGLFDLWELKLRPTPYFENPGFIDTFHTRIKEKSWLSKYPKLKIVL